MTESSPQNCSTVAVAVNTLLVSLTLRFIAAHHLIRSQIKATIIKMIAQEPIEDHLIPQAHKLLENAWTEKRMEITAEIQSRSTALGHQLSADTNIYFETKKKALLDEADAHLSKFEAELDAKTTDELQKLKNKSKTTLQLTKEENDSHTLSLAI